MRIFGFLFLLIAIAIIGCSGKKAYGEINPEFQIVRFDNDLYQYLINNQNDSVLIKHQSFLKEYGEKVIYIGSPDSTGFYERLKSFFSEPALMKLYTDEQFQLADIKGINEELSYGMEVLLSQFQSLKRPTIYMHVSGLNQNVIVNDEILSLSSDKYMGADYPLYQDFFYDYRRQLMSCDRIVPDYLLGFMMANFPFAGNAEVLLDRMLYEGKLRYILSRLIPQRQEWEYVGYTKDQYEWCKTHQAQMWKSLLENRHLFTPHFITTLQYLNEAPYTAPISVESPGRTGIWIGYQIICSFMKNHPYTSLQELMNNTDYKELLKQSKYRP
jgi:hypothetical protein